MDMPDLIGRILCSSIKHLCDNQTDILKFTPGTAETEWNLGHHLANEIQKYLFWLDHDIDLTKRNYENRRPDIVFHRRNTNALNFLVIELKHRGSDNTDDIRKITDDWMRDNLHYRFGASIKITDENKYEIRVFEKYNSKTYNQGSNSISITKLSPSKLEPLVNSVKKIFTISKERDYSTNPTKQVEVKK